ncbi:metallophosphoesterase [Nocardioides sp. R-C-SC26]|uniref:metallophosphoesterase n=1 Tax=Nocardioides sp. R-C-SC26 TaxID=2870414 RepID=UPI001E49B859|nr:metallophosphoesterase [Nocardioides sp. R-C-SC26]
MLPDRARLRLLSAAATASALALGACASPDSADADRAGDTREAQGASLAITAAAAAAPGDASWTDGRPLVNSLDPVRARVDIAAGTEQLVVRLQHAQVTAIPQACLPSTVTRRRSDIVGAATLQCQPRPDARVVTIDALAIGETGDRLTGTATVVRDGRTSTSSLPARTIALGRALRPDTRLVSSPDFLNGDVGDLREGPSSWTPRRSTNSTNAAYERTLAKVLDDWASLRPLAVLVAGDLVDGRWGYDDHDTGNFGPVETIPQARRALRRAARTYYPQWKARFTERGLFPVPAPGDHEYGDNPWSRKKLALAGAFKSEYARTFTRDAEGRPVFADHPEGPAATTAYAGRPTPDVQVVSLDVFSPSPRGMRIGLDPQQFEWLRGVLARAKRDRVEWILVQGHTPIIWPVASRGSSRLHYPGGTSSRLWKLLRRYDVDLYLAGEVHDTTAVERDGVVQISHGGIFQFGLTTALVIDFYGPAAYLTLRDYDIRHSDVGPRLWETRREGMPAQLRMVGTPFTIGTAILQNGRLVAPSGILQPRG